MQEHFDHEDNQDITLMGIHPLMNTYPFDKTFIDARYFKGKHKVDSLQGDMMNIGFIEGNEPDLYKGEVTEWIAFDDVHEVYVVDKYKLFVKGIHVVVFLVQLRDKNDSTNHKDDSTDISSGTIETDSDSIQ